MNKVKYIILILFLSLNLIAQESLIQFDCANGVKISKLDTTDVLDCSFIVNINENKFTINTPTNIKMYDIIDYSSTNIGYYTLIVKYTKTTYISIIIDYNNSNMMILYNLYYYDMYDIIGVLEIKN